MTTCDHCDLGRVAFEAFDDEPWPRWEDDLTETEREAWKRAADAVLAASDRGTERAAVRLEREGCEATVRALRFKLGGSLPALVAGPVTAALADAEEAIRARS